MRNTKIIHQVTLKHMKMNAKRSLISIIGIALMVMLLTCVFAGKDTAFKYFTDLGSMKHGSYHYAVYDIDQPMLEQIKNLKGIKEVGVTEDLKFTEFEQTGNPEKPFLSIRRYSDNALNWANIKLVDGRLPEATDEIVISEAAIKEGSSIKIGDKISVETFRRFMSNNMESGGTTFSSPAFEIPAGETVEVPDRMFYFVPGTEFGDEFYKEHEEIHEKNGFAQDFTVVGIVEKPDFEERLGEAWYTAITVFDEETLQSKTFNAMLKIDPKNRNKRLTSELSNLVGYENMYCNDIVLVFSGLSSDNSLNYTVVTVQTFFVALIMLISLVLIYNVFALSYDERVKYLGMLSSVGATAKQKRSSIYYESTLLLIPALPVGLLAGLGLIKIAAGFMGPVAGKLFNTELGEAVVNSIKPSLNINPLTLVLIVVLSIVTVLISAYIPARKMSKVGPIESIRGNKSGKAAKRRDSNSKRLLSRTSEAMISSRFLRNDKSKSSGIIRAVTIFLLVTTVICYTSSLVMQMVDFKLKESSITISAEKEHKYGVFIAGDISQEDRDEIYDTLNSCAGVSNITTVKRDVTSMLISNDSISDEYWDKYYEIASLHHGNDGYTREQFDSEFKYPDEFSQTFVGVIAFDDEVFEQIAKETNAVSYGKDEKPCILLDSASVSTDSLIIFGMKSKDYRYLEIDHPFGVEAGQNVGLEPMGYTRKEAEELGLDIDDMAFAETEVEGYADFKVISKADLTELGKYMGGMPPVTLYVIVPMSVADYIDQIQPAENALSSFIYFDCDNPGSVEEISAMAERFQEEGINVFFSTASYDVTEFRDILSYLIRCILVIFISIASIICLLNVYSSISALMVSRRKHFAVLKSLGTTYKQLVTIELRESIGMVLRSILIAAPLTAIICFGISYILISRFGHFTITFPWIFILILVAVIIAATILMTSYCLRREHKIDIIEEIKRESV